MGKRLPKSIRKFIRQEKARLRREILDSVKLKEEIKNLYNRFINNSAVAGR